MRAIGKTQQYIESTEKHLATWKTLKVTNEPMDPNIQRACLKDGGLVFK